MVCFRTGDPHSDFDRHDREQSEWMNSLPKCCECKKPIQDEQYYKVHGNIYCTECMNDEFCVTNQF